MRVFELGGMNLHGDNSGTLILFALLISVVIVLLGVAFLLNNFEDRLVSLNSQDSNVVQDYNYTLEHLALANNQRVILDSLGVLQVQHVCGVNDLVLDSNRLVETEAGVFVVYECARQVS
jgi:Tfp pilus assembly protein PilO|tara:strand:+ start:2563 stop:2922 length:360 start_codon:yes stop_codon:yes gene_type:complete